MVTRSQWSYGVPIASLFSILDITYIKKIHYTCIPVHVNIH